ncbi:MAG TPA: hypothetical protein VGK02_00025, partial [Candidatus Aquicultor sp.]
GGIVTTVRHPIQTAKAIGSAVANYKGTAKALKSAVNKARKDYATGNAATKGKIVGRVAGEVILGVVGTKGVDKLGKVAKVGKLGKAAEGAGEAAKAGSASRVFWSGAGSREAAETFAKANGAKTLEMTLTGRTLDKITTPGNFKYVKPLWDAASRRFANGATGAVDVFHSSKGVRLDSVWTNTEYPILSKQGNTINYHVVD